MARSETVGVIGLGRMGSPLARRLVGEKVPLMVWDIVREARKPFEKIKGVEVAEPSEMARRCKVIFFVVPSSAEIEQCLKGKSGVLENARPGLVIYDLTTSDPVKTRGLARLAEKKGIHYLDAGMSGAPSGVLAGTLTLMVGGDAKVLRRTKRFLRHFAKNIFHLGEVGSGHAMKIVNNMVTHTAFLATCQAARLVERMGMRVEDMVEVFNVSTAFSYASRYRFPKNILSGKWNALARIYNPHKDVGLAVALGKKYGAEMGLIEETYAFLKKAAARGMLEEDYSLLFREFEKIRRVQA